MSIFPYHAGATYKERLTNAKIRKICNKISRYRSCKDLGDEGGAEIFEGAIERDFAMIKAMLSELPDGENSTQAGRYRGIVASFNELKEKPVNLQYSVKKESPARSFNW